MQVRKAAVKILQNGFVWLFTAGCAATGPAFTPVNPIPAEKGVVYIYREPKTIGCAASGTLSANDSLIAVIQNGGYCPYIADPGLVHFAIASSGTSIADVNVAPREEKYLKVSVGMFSIPPFKLSEVSPDVGGREIRKCKLLGPIESSARPLNKADFTRFFYFGIGYSANLPGENIGASCFLVRPKGIGAYIDAKVTFFNEPVQTYPTGPPDPESNRLLDKKTVWLSFNAALTRPVTSIVTVYGGMGYSRGKELGYYEYHNLPHEHYYIVNPLYWTEVRTTNVLNLICGVLMAFHSHLGVQLGFETQPTGVTAGLFVMFGP